MPNHQLAPAKYHFCDSCIEHLMFRSKTKIVARIHCAKEATSFYCSTYRRAFLLLLRPKKSTPTNNTWESCSWHANEVPPRLERIEVTHTPICCRDGKDFLDFTNWNEHLAKVKQSRNLKMRESTLDSQPTLGRLSADALCKTQLIEIFGPMWGRYKGLCRLSRHSRCRHKTLFSMTCAIQFASLQV